MDVLECVCVPCAYIMGADTAYQSAARHWLSDSKLPLFFVIPFFSCRSATPNIARHYTTYYFFYSRFVLGSGLPPTKILITCFNLIFLTCQVSLPGSRYFSLLVHSILPCPASYCHPLFPVSFEFLLFLYFFNLQFLFVFFPFFSRRRETRRHRTIRGFDFSQYALAEHRFFFSSGEFRTDLLHNSRLTATLIQ